MAAAAAAAAGAPPADEADVSQFGIRYRSSSSCRCSSFECSLYIFFLPNLNIPYPALLIMPFVFLFRNLLCFLPLSSSYSLHLSIYLPPPSSRTSWCCSLIFPPHPPRLRAWLTALSSGLCFRWWHKSVRQRLLIRPYIPGIHFFLFLLSMLPTLLLLSSLKYFLLDHLFVHHLFIKLSSSTRLLY